MRPGSDASVELTFAPSLELIPVVRRFVSAFYEELLSHADAASRLALATHELLENTVKRRHARRQDGSGLGLARIAAEAEMTLEHEVRGDVLSLTARATLPGEPRRGAAGGALPGVSGVGFTATTGFDGRKLLLRCQGNADLAAKQALEDLLPRVHLEAQRLATREVVVDLTALSPARGTGCRGSPAAARGCRRHLIDAGHPSPSRNFRDPDARAECTRGASLAPPWSTEATHMPGKHKDPKGVGESTERRGENMKDHDGKEAGRHDTDTQGPSNRPTGESSPRDVTGVKPDKADPPITE